MLECSYPPPSGLHLLPSVIENIPIANISKIQTRESNLLEINSKDYKKTIFRTTQAAEVLLLLQGMMKSIEETPFAFSYFEKVPQASEGWQIYNFAIEMKRQQLPNENWRVYDNSGYTLCDSYPKHFIIPAGISDEEVTKIANFRAESRVPALTYLHRNGGSISRSAQPLVGVLSHSCDSDQKLLELIRMSSGDSSVVHILDARAKISAVASRALSGGYETHSYKNVKMFFCGISDVVAVRHSNETLTSACNSPSGSFLSNISSSKWLNMLSAILTSAKKAAGSVYKGFGTLVHCTGGWGRTSQICSLAQILLDPYYRTIKGFEVLIEKDWRSFGHRIERISNDDDKGAGGAPLFSQFVDCVWQIKQQFPNEFEFNDEFLQMLLYHFNSQRFGTFLYEVARERMEKNICNTVSLWSYVNCNRFAFVNIFYRPRDEFLRIGCSTVEMLVWREQYCFQTDQAMKHQQDCIRREVDLLSLYRENELLKQRIKILELESSLIDDIVVNEVNSVDIAEIEFTNEENENVRELAGKDLTSHIVSGL